LCYGDGLGLATTGLVGLCECFIDIKRIRVQNVLNHVRAVEALAKLTHREEVRSMVGAVVHVPADKIIPARRRIIIALRSPGHPPAAIAGDENGEQLHAIR
jgi:hypothetical protein